MIPIAALVEHLDHLQRRVVQEALASATSAYWIRRAEAFEAARPTAEEAHGHANPDQLRAQWLELTEIARACRNRAALAPVDSWDSPDCLTGLGEAA